MKRRALILGITLSIACGITACGNNADTTSANAATPETTVEAETVEPEATETTAPVETEVAPATETAAETETQAQTNTVDKEKQSIGLEGVDNARQLGGYVNTDGKKVKENVLLRTGKLCNATEEDIKKLTDTYHLAEIVDFRTTAERENAPDPEMEGVTNVHLSVMEDTSTAGSSAATAAHTDDPLQSTLAYVRSNDPATMYIDIASSEHSQGAYEKYFQELVNNGDGAILWHCTAGKDRAGLGSVLLLSALGVDQETILQDFDMSNQFYQEAIEQMAALATEQGCTEKEIDDVKTLTGVKRAYMEDALKFIDSEYGSMDEYLKNQIKLTDEDIATLQAKYLEA